MTDPVSPETATPADHSVYCYLTQPKPVTLTRELCAGVNLDWDADGEAIGIEVLNVQRVVIDGAPVPAAVPQPATTAATPKPPAPHLRGQTSTGAVTAVTSAPPDAPAASACPFVVDDGQWCERPAGHAGSHYSEDPTHAGSAVPAVPPDRISELEQLEKGWDSYGGEEMQPGVADRGRALLAVLASSPRIGLTGSGGLHLAWGDDEDVTIELEPGGGVEVLIEDRDLTTPPTAQTRVPAAVPDPPSAPDEPTYWGGRSYPADVWGSQPKRGVAVRLVQTILQTSQLQNALYAGELASALVDALIEAGLIENESPAASGVDSTTSQEEK